MVHALVDAGDCVMVIDNLATGFDGAVAQEASLVIRRLRMAALMARIRLGKERRCGVCLGQRSLNPVRRAAFHLSECFPRVRSIERSEPRHVNPRLRRLLKQLDVLGSFCQNPGFTTAKRKFSQLANSDGSIVGGSFCLIESSHHTLTLQQWQVIVATRPRHP